MNFNYFFKCIAEGVRNEGKHSRSCQSRRSTDGQPTVKADVTTTSSYEKWRESSTRVARKWLRYAAVFLLIFTIGVTSVWGAETLYETITLLDNGKDSDGSRPFNASSSTSGVLTPADSVSFTATTSYVYQAQSGLGWKLSSNEKNGTLTFSLAHTIPKVTKIVVNAKRYHATKGTKLDCNSLGQQTLTTSLEDYTFTYGSATNISQIVLAPAAASSGDRRCYITTIKIYYDAPSGGCTSNPTVTAGSNSSVTATTATVSCTSGISSLGSAGCSISSYGFVIGTSANPEIGGSGVTQHEVGSTYTTTGTSFSLDLTGLTASTHYYVRPYATNGNGTAYGTQTDFTTSALPKYTVTFNPGNGVCGTASSTEANAGDGVTLPSATHACGAWTLAGWATATCSQTTTAPTLYAAGSTYHPTSNVTLYAVYKKASSGGGSGTITLSLSSFDYSGWTAGGYDSGIERTCTVSGVDFGGHFITKNNKNSPSGASACTNMQTNNKSNIYNKSAIPGAITRVEVTQAGSSPNSMSLYCGNSQLIASDDVSDGPTPSSETKITDISSASTMTWDVTGNYDYFDIKRGSGTAYITSIVVSYSSVTYTYNSNPTCSGPELSASKLAVNFGTQNINSETDEPLTITGVNLTANATLTLGGANSAMFAVTPTTLTPTAGAISDADNVTVTYTPTAAGTHNATLTISSTGASDVVINLTGTCAIVCTTPTLSFDAEVVNKFQGDGTFKNPLTVSGNALNAAVTYSSDNTSCAEVAADGTVTIVNANTSGGSVRITATIAAANNGVSCQNTTSRYYTLVIKNKVTWYVNNDEYTDGAVTEAWESGTIANLPDEPDGSTMCGGKTFIGWTTSAGDWDDTPPTPLYKTAGAIPAITANAEFHAVFATAEGTGTETLSYGWEDADATTNWTINNLDASTAYSKSGSKSGAGSSSSSTIQTKDIINPSSISFWISKNSNNINSSNVWNIQTSTDGSSWTTRGSSVGTNSLTKGTFAETTLDLSTYSNVYVRVQWNNNAAGLIDDISIEYDNTTYSSYSTSCGTCLPAPNPISVTPRSNGATLSWSAVADATGYNVTCTQGGSPAGTVTVSGTTATITGLSSLTTYNYTIQSIGTTPYTCFPTKKGTFTTTDCDDVPVLGEVTTDASTATITWTCSAATATIKTYSDAGCSADETVLTGKTSGYTITGLTSETTYYYKVFAGGSCASAVGSFTTEKIQMDVAEWREDAVVISYNGDADLTLTTYQEETHGDPHANVAEDIFFSKYFESAGAVKMIALFNGKLSDVDLSEYTLCLGQSVSDSASGPGYKYQYKKFKDFVKSDGNKLSADELLLESNEEIIFISYTSSDNDATIVSCAQDHESESKFSSYIKISTPDLQFNGDDAVGLKNSEGVLIDLIGAGNGTRTDVSNIVEVTTSAGTVNGFMDKPGGWYTTDGYQKLSGNEEASGYALSTNRCLLIRRNHVKSGHIAVELNTTDFVTLGDHTYNTEPREGEWKGVQIPGSTTQGTKPGLTNACTGFESVGGYNYNEYYTDFEVTGTPTTFEDLKSDPFDGTYVIPVENLDKLACLQVRIELADGSSNVLVRKDFQVPIMVTGNKYTNDAIFNNNDKGPEVCKTCDVVILANASLEKLSSSAPATDAVEVRNVKVYQGGSLIVPSGKTYKVKSLALRREGDVVSKAKILGTLDVTETDGIYLDVHADGSNWHFFSLPFNCSVDAITFADGSPATIGTDYRIQYYDGAYRAANKSGGWKDLAAGATLAAGHGYVIGMTGEENIKKEIRFPMSKTLLTTENSNKEITGFYAYGCEDDELTPNHKGWNLLGNPYLLPYNSNIAEPLPVNKLIEDGETWTRNTDGLRYIVTPINNGTSGYEQVAIGDGFSIPPFTSYFIQVGGDDEDENTSITFTASRKTSIVRRELLNEEDNHPIWMGLELYNPKGESDHTALLISNKFTDGYDMMNDLVKLRGKYYKYPSVTTKPVLASRNNKEELAFNALPEESAATAGVPLNYYAAQAGTFTFALDSRYSLDEIKSAMLYDATTNQYYDLMENNYSFQTAKGDNNSRFRLFVRVERKQTEVTTDNDNILANGELSLMAVDKTLLLSGLTEAAEVYVYDMSGKLLTSDRANGNGAIWRAHVPAAGVYFVRVNGAQGQQTLRTIVK